MYGASARHQPTGRRPSAPNPRVPVGLTWCGSAERRDGSYLPQSPQICGFPLWLGNWRIVQLCGRRQMYGTTALVYPTCLPVAPLGRQTGTTASDLAVLTGDLVLADDRRFPFFFTPKP